MSNRDSASPIDAAPTHKPPLGALLEVAGLWWLILCAGVLLIAVLLLRVYGTEVNHIQHARVSLTVTELQESIETDIALGLDLSENRAIQAQLERALAADPALHAIEVVRKDGVALFSTDRGAIGESWQPAVAVAAPASLVVFEGLQWLGGKGLDAGRDFQVLQVQENQK